MEWDKDVSTNLGITIILIFAALFTIIDFYIVGAYVDGYPFNELSIGISNKTIDKNDNNESILSEEDALSIGKTLFDKMGEYYIQHGPRKVDSNGIDIGYSRNNDGLFSITDNSNGNAPYFMLDKEKLRMISTEDYIRDYCIVNDFIYSEGEYYVTNGDRGSNISYVGYELNVLLKSENLLLFDVTSAYYADTTILDATEDSPIKYEHHTFRLVKEEGIWKISEFHAVY